MRIIILSILFIIGLSLGIATVAYVTPFYLYKQVINNKLKTDWYLLDNYTSGLLISSKMQTLEKNNESEKFWKLFHFGDLNIPMPVKNPFYFVVPNLTYFKEARSTKFSLSILDANGEVLSDIYFLPNIKFPDYLSEQRIFELPVIRNYIELYNKDKIWKDIFEKDITKWKTSFTDMAYNLYLLEFRSKFFKKGFIKFGQLEYDNYKALELKYPDKDYKSELIMKKRGNRIHSYIIITRKKNDAALKIRSKIIRSMSYADTSPALADIIFKEFKSLKYTDQIDHLGMLYLLSAWSHDQNRKEILQKIIFYLERGFNNQKQLEPLYTYYYKRYGEIYSKRKVDDLNLDVDVMLQKKIKNEEAQEMMNRQTRHRLLPEKQKSVEEQFEDVINKSRVKKSKDSKVMRID